MPCALILAQQRPVFRAGAMLVTVDAYPQQNGLVVEGLTPADFEVLEDGKPQKIEAFDFIRVEPARSDAERRDPKSGQEGNALAADPRNRLFVVYLDAQHVTINGSHDIRVPLTSVLRRILAPNDLFGVMHWKMRPQDLVFGGKLETLEDQLGGHWPWGERLTLNLDTEEQAIQDAFQVDAGGKPTDWAQQLIERLREDRVLTSLEQLLPHLGNVRDAKTNLLLISDGWHLFAPDDTLMQAILQGSILAHPIPAVGVKSGGTARLALGGKDTNDPSSLLAQVVHLTQLDDVHRYRKLITEANRRNVTFYPIDPEGLEVFDSDLHDRYAILRLEADRNRIDKRVATLDMLADDTGGVAVHGTNDLVGGVQKIVNDVSAYYLLGYYSTNTKFDGAYRRIDVKLRRPGLTIKARRGYLAPDNARPRPGAVPDSVLAKPTGLEEALAVLSQGRPDSRVAVYATGADRELVLVTELSSALAPKWMQGAEVRAFVTSGSGVKIGMAAGQLPTAARGTLLRLPLPADISAADRSGPWRIDVRVLAAGDEVEDTATISAAPPGTLLGAPIAYRAASGPRSPMHPVADFQFRRTERVHIEWPIVKPLDQRSARVLSRTGQPLAVVVNLTETGGAPPALINNLSVDLNLAPLGAGEYVIEVTAGAGAETERRLVAFRIVG